MKTESSRWNAPVLSSWHMNINWEIELNYVESSVIDRKIRNVAKLQRDTCEKELSGTSG